MDTKWASDHLQIIRTLMERTALYRRALAPVMLLTGSIGIVASIITCFINIESNSGFALFWLGVGAFSLAASFLLVRRQAIKDSESVWSPPTKRVTQALLPAFLVGAAAGLYHLCHPTPVSTWWLSLVWLVTYGCALHAAAFFMQRGITLFGWTFIASGIALLLLSPAFPQLQTTEAAHYVMGTFFGVLHLAYGLYLYFTEKRKTESEP